MFFWGGEGKRFKGLWELSSKSIRARLFLPPDGLVLGIKSFIFSQLWGN